jgi:hypothetical protein
MSKLKLGTIESDKPVRVSIELPANVHRDLLAYAQAHAQETGQTELKPLRLISAMLARFMATDREFTRFRRSLLTKKP